MLGLSDLAHFEVDRFGPDDSGLSCLVLHGSDGPSSFPWMELARAVDFSALEILDLWLLDLELVACLCLASLVQLNPLDLT